MSETHDDPNSKANLLPPATSVAYQGQYHAILLDKDGSEYVGAGDEVLVVPLTAQGEVILTSEPAPAFGETTLVVPGGQTEVGEPYETTANRELQEEAGFKAGRLDPLGELRPFSKYLNVRSFVYLGRELTPSRLQGDENYVIDLVRLPLAGFEDWVASGRLRDARTIAALYLARSFLNGKKTMSTVNQFEEYKLWIEDTARFTDRRQAASSLYVGVNTLLLGAVGLLVKDANLQRQVIPLVTIPLLLTGIFICLTWRALIKRYKNMIRLRFDVLRAMEDLPEMAGCQGMYHKEDNVYQRTPEGELVPGIKLDYSTLELFLPVVFIILYLAFMVGILYAWRTGLIA